MPNQYSSVISLLQRLWKHISKRRRAQLGLLLTLMFVAAFAEIFSLGALVPFLSVLIAPDKMFNHPLIKDFLPAFGIMEANQLILPLTITFSIAVLLSGAMRLVLAWFQTRLSAAIGTDISVQVYERTLFQPYSVHISRHSSEILSGLQKVNYLVINIIQPVLVIVSSVLLLVFVLSALFIIQPFVTSIAILGFVFIYFIISMLTKRRLEKNSSIYAENSILSNQAVQEGLGGIRDILIDGTQKTYTNIFRRSFISMQRANAVNQVIGLTPRYAVEALGMVLIAILAFSMALSQQGVISAIPVLGVLALGAQRMLPLVQQIYNSYVSIIGGKQSLVDVILLLDQPYEETREQYPNKVLTFNDKIELKNIGFRYKIEDEWILRNINLEIPKGNRVGIIGSTGCGKSTLLDIIMGLLEPNEGQLLVDKKPILSYQDRRSWQSNIAHVPQTIFLSSNSIAENIAFGVPKEKIDMNRVMFAANLAQISSIIETWQYGYDTNVGERGIKLSGGQRQRIGIARALYKNASILIFDEATSALDSSTENSVMKSINKMNKDLTVIIVAHRISTLEACDTIIELESGKIKNCAKI